MAKKNLCQTTGNIIRNMLFNHKGTGHKIAHNVTTIASIPLVLWLMYMVYALRGASYEQFQTMMSQPLNMVLAIVFVITSLTHFVLEIEVVFEDYISDEKRRHFIIKSMKVASTVLAIVTIISILKFGM